MSPNWSARKKSKAKPPRTEPEDTVRLVVGLGNPGPRYSRTRHNLGFLVLDELVRRAGGKFSPARQAESARLGSTLLLKPLTYMNNSGLAIQAALARHGVRPEELLVVHDDLDLDLGRLRLRFGGSSGGQRGVQDTLSRIGKDFWRLKLGISAPPAGWETANWVLSRFSAEEQDLLAQVVSTGADAVEHVLTHGPHSAANHFNGLRLT